MSREMRDHLEDHGEEEEDSEEEEVVKGAQEEETEEVEVAAEGVVMEMREKDQKMPVNLTKN
jgi:hypothetical protein